MLKSPFKLLAAYQSEEKDIFFGRDSEIFALYHLLKQTRLVLVYGASGTGKTSIIQAGLPKVFKISDWLPILIRRNNNINESLQNTLVRFGNRKKESTDLIELIQTIYEDRWMPIYLVFDQFEEIFTLGHEEECQQFFQNIQSILDRNLPCKIILSMREEYIGHLYDYESIVPSLFEKRFRIESMQDGTLREVIKKMCNKYQIILENGDATITQILDQIKIGKQAAYLPYLQIYLHYLFEYAIKHFGKAIFNTEAIEAIGQLGNVLKQFINSKTSDAQEYLSQFEVTENFAEQLLDEFATSEGTKQSQHKSDLATRLSVSEKLMEKALIYFSDTAKLLRADENEVDRYEPVHDVLAKQIHELRSTEDKEYKNFERKLELDYERWVDNKTSTDLLLRQSDLNKVEVFQKKLEQKEAYQEKYLSLIRKSIAFIQRQKRRKQLLISILFIVSIVAIALGLYAKNQERQAKLSFENFKKEEAERVLLDVKRITEGAKSIKDDYPEIMKMLIEDAKKRLSNEEYLDNPKLQQKLKELEEFSIE